jgi:hypothetical protein
MLISDETPRGKQSDVFLAAKAIFKVSQDREQIDLP